MGKGSNLRPRDVPKKLYDKHWDKIFNQPVKKTDSKREKPDNAK